MYTLALLAIDIAWVVVIADLIHAGLESRECLTRAHWQSCDCRMERP